MIYLKAKKRLDLSNGGDHDKDATTRLMKRKIIIAAVQNQLTEISYFST